MTEQENVITEKKYNELYICTISGKACSQHKAECELRQLIEDCRGLGYSLREIMSVLMLANAGEMSNNYRKMHGLATRRKERRKK